MKFWYRPNFIAICAIIILSVPALFSLSTAGFYTSHDGATHTARIAQYYVALKDGQLPPRFAGTFYNGLGSPIFVYIYSLPYLLGALLHFAGLSFVSSFKLLMALGFIFSGIFSYLFLKELTKNTKSAFVGSMFYIWSPYRLSLIYVRGSLSEHLAYTFLPLVFFAFIKLVNTKKIIWIPVAAVFTSLLLLSQDLVALIAAPLVFFFVFILAIQTKSIKFFIYSIFAGIWGLLISSFVYLPSILEINNIKLHQIIHSVYADHFVYFKQLIYSPWGYGFDLPGTINDGMSFQIGLAHLLALVLFLILFTFFLIGKIKKNYTFDYFNQLKNNDIMIIIFLLVTIFVSVFLMTYNPLAKIIWSSTPIGNYIDIPWRLTGLVIFCLSVIIAYFIKAVKYSLVVFVLIFALIVANRNNLRINKSQNFDDKYFLNYSESATQYSEFTPKWRQTTRNPIGFDQKNKIKILAGDVHVIGVKNKSNEISLDIDIKSNQAQILINKFYFPNTLVYKNNQKLQLDKDYFISESVNLRLDTQEDTSGLIFLPLAYGKQTITMKYQETNLRFFADILSLGSLIIALGLIAINVKK